MSTEAANSGEKRRKDNSRFKDKSRSLGREQEAKTPEQIKAEEDELDRKNKEAEQLQLINGEKWWETGKFSQEGNPNGLAEMSDYTVLFPQYRELYFKQVWPLVKHFFEKQMLLDVAIDYGAGVMTVTTTPKTWDPCAILNGKTILLLMSRGCTFEKSIQILNPGILYDVIKIKRYVRNYQVFMNRRQRLLGPNGATLKAIELLTKCSMTIQGKTVTVIGPMTGLKEVRRLVEDCMNNIHPIYHIKQLMIKRELAKNPKLAHESWDKYLPKFKKNVNKKRIKNKKPVVKKEYTPFPPAPEKSKVDIELETGQYFLSEQQKKKQQMQELKKKQQEKKTENLKKRLQVYVPPEDDVSKITGKQQSKFLVNADAMAERAKKSNTLLKKRSKRGGEEENNEDDEEKEPTVEDFMPKKKKRTMY